MAEFLKVHAVSELQEGLLLEIVPKLGDLPVLQPGRMQDFLVAAEKGKDDFYQILGIEPPVSYGEEKPARQGEAAGPKQPGTKGDLEF